MFGTPDQGFDHEEAHEEMMKLLLDIANQCYETKKKLEIIEDYVEAVFPSGEKSIQQTKRAHLIEIYAKHLESKEKLSAEDARLRAQFEIQKFDIDTIREDINREIKNGEEKMAEENFAASELFKKDVENFWTSGNIQTGERWIGEYDLFAPIYHLMKSPRYSEGRSIYIDPREDKNYYSYIKNRAVAQNLVRLGILSEVRDEKERAGTLHPRYRLAINDLNKISEIIYKGPRKGHDDSFFDERLADGELEHIFEFGLN